MHYKLLVTGYWISRELGPYWWLIAISNFVIITSAKNYRLFLSHTNFYSRNVDNLHCLCSLVANVFTVCRVP